MKALTGGAKGRHLGSRVVQKLVSKRDIKKFKTYERTIPSRFSYETYLRLSYSMREAA